MAKLQGSSGNSAAVAEVLLAHKSFIVASHYSPDADAYGSLLGVSHALRALGKEVVALNQDGINPRFSFLPGMDTVVSSIPAGQFDCLVACDCGDEKRLGDKLSGPLLALPMTLNIDHHISNNHFAKLNWVEGHASSTCEMVYGLVRELERKSGKNLFSTELAICLFAGISADTGSFRYASTAPSTFDVARELVTLGARPEIVAEALYERNSIAATRLQAHALTGLTLLAGGKICKVVVPDSMYATYKASPDDTEELVERARAIDGVRIAVLIREEDGLWKASLRAKGQEYDVSKVAQQFGGGGHRAAAGFRWRGEFKDLDAKLTAILESTVGNS